jgi:putative colanic acid biosynthesis UDP-glucose lipid carrier transferase
MNAQLQPAPAANRQDAVSGAPAPHYERTQRVQFGLPEPVWLTIIAQFDLVAVILTLFACLLTFREPLTVDYALLAALGAAVCSRCVTAPDIASRRGVETSRPLLTVRLLVEWGAVVGILLLVGFAFKVSDVYSRSVLLTWFVTAPAALAVSHRLQTRLAPWFGAIDAAAARFVVVGANALGVEVSRRLSASSCRGFFDFRSRERVEASGLGEQLVGHCGELAEFVRRQAIGAVYIALPIGNSPRIRQLLSDLRDTTASVYFVPDVFAFTLIQARVVDLNGMPALAVCDTPLHGAGALSKRTMDVVLASLGLLALAPLLLIVALLVKLGSRGPVLFRQRRYGLDGGEIVVYKFRTMTVMEDGGEVRQASRDDQRITRLGRMLRRSSIDELPQLWNVLEGKMSLVGPRPHAIAHNELYRKLISGYMVRHKVRPGLTGWAQVHGLRGETDKLEKMEQRVRYDLDYLQRWSLMLDLTILLRTVKVIFEGRNAH